MKKDLGTMEGLADCLDACSDIFELILYGRLKEAKDIILNSPFLLDAPFIHYKHGSMTSNGFRVFLHDRSQLLNKANDIGYVKSHGWKFDELLEFIVDEEVKGRSGESILAELKQQNSIEIVDDLILTIQNAGEKDFLSRKSDETVKKIRKSIGRNLLVKKRKSKTNPHSHNVSLASLRASQEIYRHMKLNYQKLNKFIVNKEWNAATEVFTKEPSTLLWPYLRGQSVEEDHHLTFYSPLHTAFVMKAPIEFIKCLLNVGGKRLIDGAYNLMQGEDPVLHWIAYRENVEMVQLLVDVSGEHIIHVRARGLYGRYTPLHLALKYGAPLENIKYLIDVGGKRAVNSETEASETPLLLAIKNSSLCSLETIRLLVAVGEEQCIQNIGYRFQTPFLEALTRSRFDVAKLLLDSSVDSASLFKIGNPEKNSCLVLFVTRAHFKHLSHTSEGRFVDDDEAFENIVRFILEHCSLEQIPFSIFGLFDTNGPGTHRAFKFLLSKLGHHRAWNLVTPFLQRFNDNVKPILSVILELFFSPPILLERFRLLGPRNNVPLSTRSTKKLQYEETLILRNITERFPGCAYTRDGNDRLPFHHLCEKGYCWDFLRLVLDLNQDATAERDGKTGLSAFALAAAGLDTNNRVCEHELTTVYHLLRKFPEQICF